VERLWAVGIARGETHDTGLVTLRRGASVAAWVRFAEGDGRPDECSARLFPFVPAGRARPTEAQRAARSVAEASVLDNGFVQLGPVAAGTYALEVTHPDYAPAQVYPLELRRDDETLLRDPVELRRPLTVGIAIHPPTDWRGLPWQVLLARASDLTGSYAGGSAFEGGTDAEGRVVVADQTPGAFVLKVLDSTGDPFYARMDLVIDSADDARVEVDIDLVVLTGEVTLDDEPVQATLWFGGRHGASRVELRSDLEGRFAGVLPRAGWWRLELAAPEQDLEVETRVEIEPGRSGDAFLRLELPDTELFGRVVDEQGRGVAEAKVWLRDTQGFTQKRTNETGEFEFRAFEPGPAEVGASASTPAGRLTGAPVRMPVVESVPLGPVELRLRRTRTLTGRVVSAAGRPVAAALIDLSTFSPLTAAYSSSVRSGPDGTFEAEVHPDAEALQAVVSPPGYSLQSLTLPPTDPLVLNLTREHGTLILDRGPPVPPEQQPSPRRLVVLVDGTLLPHQRLLNWSRGHGEVWPEDSPTAKVPRLAPGHYRACLTTTDAMAAAALAEGSWRAALERCAEGFLSPGGSLTLQIPPADASPPAER